MAEQTIRERLAEWRAKQGASPDAPASPAEDIPPRWGAVYDRMSPATRALIQENEKREVAQDSRQREIHQAEAYAWEERRRHAMIAEARRRGLEPNFLAVMKGDFSSVAMTPDEARQWHSAVMDAQEQRADAEQARAYREWVDKHGGMLPTPDAVQDAQIARDAETALALVEANDKAHQKNFTKALNVIADQIGIPK